VWISGVTFLGSVFRTQNRDAKSEGQQLAFTFCVAFLGPENGTIFEAIFRDYQSTNKSYITIALDMFKFKCHCPDSIRPAI